ncbi:hypothetical protein [Sphaerospermopsis sp. LEGE 08334]|uniref:hypothetical protein n=1 Tax=Sphaerospermopsis sp. LEGE 08334 TaxID=1828651 RepID=UPI001881FCEB|nr:hypothetical protein [Sphaerospermopsis sp. LEGE 08334]MBE9056848.1 hypothetical protein [Sphaerospermopsis sp. LEGE 08334]
MLSDEYLNIISGIARLCEDSYPPSILDCIEQDNPSYQAVLSDTLEELRLNYEHIPEVKPEDSSAWLRNIFDKAIAEV